jgi:hypothetical protein
MRYVARRGGRLISARIEAKRTPKGVRRAPRDLTPAAGHQQLVGALHRRVDDRPPHVVHGVAPSIASGEHRVVGAVAELGLVIDQQVVQARQHRHHALGRLGLDPLHAHELAVAVLAQARDVDASSGEVEILAVQRAQFADAQPDEHQRGEYDGPRDVVAVALRRVDPDLSAADLGDQGVRDVVAAC